MCVCVCVCVCVRACVCECVCVCAHVDIMAKTRVVRICSIKVVAGLYCTYVIIISSVYNYRKSRKLMVTSVF